MIPTERIEQIKEILSEKKTVSIKELTERLYVSRSTIRRDLIELEKLGLIRRDHGGVTRIENSITEFGSSIRGLENQEEKKKISELVSTYLKDDMSIFIDSSSTTSYLCKHFKNFNNLIVVTNGLNIANELRKEENIQLFFTGGRVKNNSYSVLGQYANDFIKHFYVDITFISCKCLTLDGVFEADYEQGMLKKYMLQNSKTKILLADHRKFDCTSCVRFATLDDFDVIATDSKPPEKFIEDDGVRGKLIY